jgi:hypothetical protein
LSETALPWLQVGLSTLIEADEADENVLLALGREELLDRATRQLLQEPVASIEAMTTESLVESLLSEYVKDLSRAREARTDALAKELACRGLPAFGNDKELSELLRQQVLPEADAAPMDSPLLSSSFASRGWSATRRMRLFAS